MRVQHDGRLEVERSVKRRLRRLGRLQNLRRRTALEANIWSALHAAPFWTAAIIAFAATYSWPAAGWLWWTSGGLAAAGLVAWRVPIFLYWTVMAFAMTFALFEGVGLGVEALFDRWRKKPPSPPSRPVKDAFECVKKHARRRELIRRIRRSQRV